jgi:uncharacterized protein (DUF427 family)
VQFATNGKPIESVWAFPRPPRLERVDWRIRVVVDGVTIVDAPSALRVLETSQAPAYYMAFEHVADEHLRPNDGRPTFCEWKGVASYADIVVGDRVVPRAAWSYADPDALFADLRGHWAFYAQAVDECWVDDERVSPNEGDFYGGWITANLTGPFKGGPGSRLW